MGGLEFHLIMSGNTKGTDNSRCPDLVTLGSHSYVLCVYYLINSSELSDQEIEAQALLLQHRPTRGYNTP